MRMLFWEAIEYHATRAFLERLKRSGIILSEISTHFQIAKDRKEESSIYDAKVVEVDIYGVNEKYCLIGKVSLYITLTEIEKLKEEVEILRKYAPEKLRPKIILGLYGVKIFKDAEEEARKNNIWLIRVDYERDEDDEENLRSRQTEEEEIVPLTEILQNL